MHISVVIPTWCERKRIRDAVRAAREVGDEVIVADASSPDGTAELARSLGARVVTAPRGRGPQLNTGAREARGDVLLFLHADVCLPIEARSAIEHALAEARVGGGNFKLRFVPNGFWAACFGYANHLRRRFLRIYYGDSALFLRRSVFDALGGYPPLPIMEDYELVRRLERRTRTVYVTDVVAEASGRRFAGRPLRTLLTWVAVHALYAVGVAPEKLHRLYADPR